MSFMERSANVYATGIILGAVAFAVRLYKISNPDEVVFDEVHFGKFAAYYILREYYFDVHPPLAKLLLGAAGWFVGFDGQFDFENIGDSYTEHHVPYIGMRVLPAAFGSLTVPLAFAIMRECGYPTLVAAFSASLILFGKSLVHNGHVAQVRLILLDAALVFFMTLSLYSYIRFRKLRYWEFTFEWWAWMIATGVSLACTLGCKMVGLLTFATIGTAVLVDLWNLLDIRKGLSLEHVAKHFFARALGLIVIPFVVYLSFFWIHFKILIRSGTGDSFMSPAFQETLQNNEMLLNSQEIRYYDTVAIRHKDSKVYLHSHVERYPLRYDDGRISSQGQQVTGYPFNDTNNFWQIVPTKSLPPTGRGRIVRHKDVIQLLHVNTDSNLLTHDVASPLMPTNQEFTTWPANDTTRYDDTLFEVNILEAHDGEPWKTKSGQFRLVHVPTRVSMWTHSQPLPDWAFKQQEINGNKNAQDRTATWFVDEIVSDETGNDIRNRTGTVEDKPVKRLNFFRKFFELQMLMLQHNAGLTASHPYASGPINWPFLISGISFWTHNDTQRQIYMIGNIIGWWTCVMALSIYVGIIGADLLARRRGVYPIPDPLRNRLWNSTGLFFAAWAYHYFPFFLMSRQLFIHHYLPAHLASALLAGGVFNFIVSETINYPISVAGPSTRLRPKTHAELGLRSFIAVGVFVSALIAMFIFLSPLTYGTPGLDGNQVNRRRLLSTWTLHFAGK
ncbi:O-mannosyltransferase [Dacryopinax primogenitus]|uniref:Dolichyl-phosphate-mannose--protein mannosyltransferase n=1 Tax=Dacryopinax primogenitus (strain DJM 731) TaxID=1858805 RepID=M5GF38_DACPD|nr:O-mannosyltransferase [Dacryopinax primogenitus]EJU03808.1 O-mannosyltransferase [Dacryopinax primogenitus]